MTLQPATDLPRTRPTPPGGAPRSGSGRAARRDGADSPAPGSRGRPLEAAFATAIRSRGPPLRRWPGDARPTARRRAVRPRPRVPPRGRAARAAPSACRPVVRSASRHRRRARTGRAPEPPGATWPSSSPRGAAETPTEGLRRPVGRAVRGGRCLSAFAHRDHATRPLRADRPGRAQQLRSRAGSAPRDRRRRYGPRGGGRSRGSPRRRLTARPCGGPSAPGTGYRPATDERRASAEHPPPPPRRHARGERRRRTHRRPCRARVRHGLRTIGAAADGGRPETPRTDLRAPSRAESSPRCR